MAASPITANQLRRLAEAADGRRNEALCIVDDGINYVLMSQAEATSGGQRVLMSLNSPNDKTNLVGATYKVVFDGKEYTHPDADAVFLSQAAVEKFLLPYYARYMTPLQLEEVRRDCFDTPGVFAVLHLFPTIHQVLTTNDPAST